jgi:hypothetical protein
MFGMLSIAKKRRSRTHFSLPKQRRHFPQSMPDIQHKLFM